MALGAYLNHKIFKSLVLILEISFLVFLGSMHAAKAHHGEPHLNEEQEYQITDKVAKKLAVDKFEALQNEYTLRKNANGEEERINCGQSCLFRMARKMTTEYSLQKSMETCHYLKRDYKQAGLGDIYDGESFDMTKEDTYSNYNTADRSKLIGKCINAINVMGRLTFYDIPNTEADDDLRRNLESSDKQRLLETIVLLQENAGNLVHYNTAINKLHGLDKECLNTTREKCMLKDGTDLEADPDIVSKLQNKTSTKLEKLKAERDALTAKIQAIQELKQTDNPEVLGDTLTGMSATTKTVSGTSSGNIQVIDRNDDVKLATLDEEEKKHLYEEYNAKLEVLQKSIQEEVEALESNGPGRGIAGLTDADQNEQNFTEFVMSQYNAFVGFISGWWGDEKDERLSATSYSNLDLVVHPDLVRDIGTKYYQRKGGSAEDHLKGIGSEPVVDESEDPDAPDATGDVPPPQG
jgi:hypothetical protein